MCDTAVFLTFIASLYHGTRQMAKFAELCVKSQIPVVLLYSDCVAVMEYGWVRNINVSLSD